MLLFTSSAWSGTEKIVYDQQFGTTSIKKKKKKKKTVVNNIRVERDIPMEYINFPSLFSTIFHIMLALII
jgi:hypothetical protein